MTTMSRKLMRRRKRKKDYLPALVGGLGPPGKTLQEGQERQRTVVAEEIVKRAMMRKRTDALTSLA